MKVSEGCPPGQSEIPEKNLEEEYDQGLHCLPLCLHILCLSVHVKTTLFDYSNFSGIRILRNFMNELCEGTEGQLQIVGGKLSLSSGCPWDKLSFLAYF